MALRNDRARRRRTRLRLAALICALAAVAVAVSALRAPPAETAAAVSTPTPKLRTPAWSPRRVPGVFVPLAQQAARKRASAALTQRLTRIIAGTHACVAVDEGGAPLVRIGDGLALAPASTMKLLTATAALARLGAGSRFTTWVVQSPSGDLVVVGGGDPLLATDAFIASRHAQFRFAGAPYTRLAALADAIVAAGVHHVSGALVVDDHRDDGVRFLPAWKPIYATEGDVGALGALSVDGGEASATSTLPAADPALRTGQELAALLAARGVTIAGGIRRGVAGATWRSIASVKSAPLGAIVEEMLTGSDNYTAEMLVRAIAAASEPTAPASTANGVRFIAHTLPGLGIFTGGLDMRDGSGLAPADRVPCHMLVQVIALSRTARFAAIDRGLPVAGRTGTLLPRFQGTTLAGRLRAKTGSLDGVVGLAGTVDDPARPQFAFLANGNFSEAAGLTLSDAVGRAIGGAAPVQAPAGLVPAP